MYSLVITNPIAELVVIILCLYGFYSLVFKLLDIILNE